MRHSLRTTTLLLASTSLLIACTGGEDGSLIKPEAKYPTGAQRGSDANAIYDEPDSVFGEGGIFGFNAGKKDGEEGDSITVNSFLWRASLDTVSFMPLASADPFGGVILTDWYSPEGVSNERFKLNVFILSRQLRSDGIEVRVFKQQLRGNSWVDVEPSPETGRQLEDSILTRARQLRIAKAGE